MPTFISRHTFVYKDWALFSSNLAMEMWLKWPKYTFKWKYCFVLVRLPLFLDLGTQNFWLEANFLGTCRFVKNLERTLVTGLASLSYSTLFFSHIQLLNFLSPPQCCVHFFFSVHSYMHFINSPSYSIHLIFSVNLQTRKTPFLPFFTLDHTPFIQTMDFFVEKEGFLK